MRKAIINTLMKTASFLALLLALTSCEPRKPEAPADGRWLAGDFHNHTVLTDGSHTPAEVFAHAFGFGIDWMVNSEHGGAFGRDPSGQPWPAGTAMAGDPPPDGRMWRWQSLRDYSFPLVAKMRAIYPDKLIALGYEWNVPAHDHASVAILGQAEEQGLAVARHEYLFDRDDPGASAGDMLGVASKRAENNHAKAVAGVAWLAANYPQSSYFIINHPSRQLKYPIAAIRDFNNAAPTVAFGFEGMPGHQKAAARGGYNHGPFYDAAGHDVTCKARTYGGADYMLAKVGGPWDALLGEGRRFFTLVNSDFHNENGEFWPGEYAKTYTLVQDGNHDGRYGPDELLAGLRSGNSFIVHGELINGLRFSAQCRQQTDLMGQRTPQAAVMGATLEADPGCEVELFIRFRSPAENNHHDAVKVDHIDLIAGEVRDKVGKYLADGSTPNPDYDRDTNDTTKVLATFTGRDWGKKATATEGGNSGNGETGEGWHTIVYHLGRPEHDMYFRLRGTSLGHGMAGETDASGNPLTDELMAPNTEAKAYADLWFYSNPIFVRTGQ